MLEVDLQYHKTGCRRSSYACCARSFKSNVISLLVPRGHRRVWGKLVALVYQVAPDNHARMWRMSIVMMAQYYQLDK